MDTHVDEAVLVCGTAAEFNPLDGTAVAAPGGRVTGELFATREEEEAVCEPLAIAPGCAKVMEVDASVRLAEVNR